MRGAKSMENGAAPLFLKPKNKDKNKDFEII
jgi:hypothetical protein